VFLCYKNGTYIPRKLVFRCIWQRAFAPFNPRPGQGVCPLPWTNPHQRFRPLDSDQGLAPETHQRASVLSGHMANPARIGWAATFRCCMTRTVSSGSPRPRFRPWKTSRVRPAARRRGVWHGRRNRMERNATRWHVSA